MVVISHHTCVVDYCHQSRWLIWDKGNPPKLVAYFHHHFYSVHACVYTVCLLVNKTLCHYLSLSVKTYLVSVSIKTLLSVTQGSVRGSTLDATMKLLCAVVRGIIQREEQFVLELQVVDEQVSRLVELEDIAKNKCAVTRTEREGKYTLSPHTLTVLELKPLCEYP